jgi:prepilin-type processing-associated H-X9-DG protein
MSRRKAIRAGLWPRRPPLNAGVPDTLAKTDYAINGGTDNNAPNTWAQLGPNAKPPTATDCGPGPFPNCAPIEPSGKSIVAKDFEAIALLFNGISTRYTGAKVQQITDGTSKTALVGEKAMFPEFYELGYGEGDDYNQFNGGDNNSMYQGYDVDNTRWIGPVPQQDINDPDFKAVHHDRFGSAHAGGMNLAFCDGSVHTINYDIEDNVWGTYGNREDGKIAQ